MPRNPGGRDRDDALGNMTMYWLTHTTILPAPLLNPANPQQGRLLRPAGRQAAVEPRLDQLLRQPRPIADRQFEIEFLDPGVEALVFTFG